MALIQSPLWLGVGEACRRRLRDSAPRRYAPAVDLFGAALAWLPSWPAL